MDDAPAIKTITAPELAGRLDQDEVSVVDVRQDYEWEAGRIDGALHIPLEQLPAATDSVDRDRPIVFVCRGGSRSAMATTAFVEAGFEAINLDGGMTAWVEAGQPIVPADGEVAAPRPDNT